MIIKSIILIILFVTGFILGSFLIIYLIHNANEFNIRILKNKPKKKKQKKENERLNSDRESFVDEELEGSSEEMVRETIEKTRKGQTEAYNYTQNNSRDRYEKKE